MRAMPYLIHYGPIRWQSRRGRQCNKFDVLFTLIFFCCIAEVMAQNLRQFGINGWFSLYMKKTVFTLLLWLNFSISTRKHEPKMCYHVHCTVQSQKERGLVIFINSLVQNSVMVYCGWWYFSYFLTFFGWQ